jgi:tetratricopeptide (TPR) repeat protein
VFYPVLAGTPQRQAPGKQARAAGSSAGDETSELREVLLERKERLFRNLRELDAERAAGRIAEADYLEFKRRDEAEAARVMREIAAFDTEAKATRKKGKGAAAAAVRAQATPVAAPRKRGTIVAWVGGTALFAAVLIMTMLKAVSPRAPGGTITGTMPGGESRGDGGSAMLPRANPARLGELEQTIRRDSFDLPALLEAGHLYLAEQKLDEAAQVTIKALSLDPQSPEGHAHVAVLLMAEANSQQDPDSARQAITAALGAVNHAIQIKPDLAEGWLFKGMIMMAGLRDPQGAAQAWEQYLKVAPADADTARISAMVQAAKRAGTR